MPSNISNIYNKYSYFKHLNTMHNFSCENTVLDFQNTEHKIKADNILF